MQINKQLFSAPKHLNPMPSDTNKAKEQIAITTSSEAPFSKAMYTKQLTIRKS